MYHVTKLLVMNKKEEYYIIITERKSQMRFLEPCVCVNLKFEIQYPYA